MTFVDLFVQSDAKVVSATIGLIAVLVAATISLINAYFNRKLQKQKHEDDLDLLVKREQREKKSIEDRLNEEVTSKTIETRLEPFSCLMNDLKVLSSQDDVVANDERRRLNAELAAASIQKHIFGKFGLVASFEAREMALRLRSACLRFLEGQINFDDVILSAWKVHQMLRSDLNIPQPHLAEAVKKLKESKELESQESYIEELASTIKHIEWPHGKGADAGLSNRNFTPV